MVEPVDPLQGGVLDLVEALPGATPVDQLGLVQPDDRLGQGIVIAVATGADRGDRAGLGQALGVADGEVLGGFNWSSQHLEHGGVDGTTTGLGCSGDGEAADAVAWAAAGSA